MELGDSIVLAAIIITLGAVTIAVTLIIRKKTVAITLFSVFTILIALLIVFKNDLLRFSTNIFRQSATTYQSSKNQQQNFKYLNLSYKKIDLAKCYLTDIIFLFGKPDVITSDSSILVYGKWETKTPPSYNYKWSSDQNNFLEAKHKEQFFLNANILKDENYFDSLNFPNERYFLNGSGHYIISSSESKISFIGELGYQGNDLGKNYNEWQLNTITDNFGKVTNTWISEGDKIRIYQIRNNFFFYDGHTIYAWGISSTDNFDPTHLRPITQSLKFRKME
jgi:hypothetical protein